MNRFENAVFTLVMALCGTFTLLAVPLARIA